MKVTRADACMIFGFPEMLRSAIENVVRNAIRYTPVGTAVELALEQSENANARRARLTIRDHGPGVPKIMLTNIFLPFQRVPEGNVNNSQGAGLGLAIVDRVVKLHEGTVRATNADDGGLIVEIVLPVPEARA